MEKKKKSNPSFSENIKTTNNRFALIVCIFLASLFWLSIQLNKESVYNCTVPLRYTVPDNFILMTPLPENVTVGIKGDVSKLLLTQSKLQKSPVEIFVGKEKALTPDLIESQLVKILDPSFYKIVRIDITPTSLSIDTSLTKIVRITSNNDIELRDGHCVTSTKFSPSTVTIHGPAQIVRNVEEINASKLVLKDLHSDYQDSIVLLPSYSNLIELVNDKSLIEVTVASLVEKEMLIPMNLLTKDVSFAYDTLSLKVSLPATDYDSFDYSWIDLEILDTDSTVQVIMLTSNKENIKILEYK